MKDELIQISNDDLMSISGGKIQSKNVLKWTGIALGCTAGAWVSAIAITSIVKGAADGLTKNNDSRTAQNISEVCDTVMRYIVPKYDFNH